MRVSGPNIREAGATSAAKKNNRMPAHEYQKETVFLRAVIAYDDTEERHQLDARIALAQRDQRCVRRAVAVMVLVAGLAVAGLGYAAVLLPQNTLNLSRFFSHPVVRLICALGLTALGCAFAFLILGAVYRWRLERLHAECRRFAARVIASRLGQPAARTYRADRDDGEAGENLSRQPARTLRSATTSEAQCPARDL